MPRHLSPGCRAAMAWSRSALATRGPPFAMEPHERDMTFKRLAILAILPAFVAPVIAVVGTASSASADVAYPMPPTMRLFVDRDVWMPVSALVDGSGPYQNVTMRSSNNHVVTDGGYSQ